MKTTFKQIIIFAFILSLDTLSAIAQTNTEPTNTYKHAIGIRAGETAGFTYKYVSPKANAFEAIFSIWPYTFGFTGLYERYFSAGVQGLNFYAGGGGHINAGSQRYHTMNWYIDNQNVYVKSSSYFGAGVDGIFGIEYKFKPIPLALSTDIKPYIEFGNQGNAYFTIDPSIGVKFTFK